MMDIMGITVRDFVLGLLSILGGIFVYLFRTHEEKIKSLQSEKADASVISQRFNDVIDRLNRQDDTAAARDLKLDRIFEAVLKK